MMNRKILATLMLAMMFLAILTPTFAVKASLDESEDEVDSDNADEIGSDDNDSSDDVEEDDSSNEGEANGTSDDGEDEVDDISDDDEVDDTNENGVDDNDESDEGTNDDSGENEDEEDRGDDELDDTDEEDEVDDEDGDDVNDEVEDSSEREINVEVGDNEVIIESKIETEESENEFEVNFSSNDGISIMLKYGNGTEASSEEVEAGLDFSVEFLSIVEYIDTDGSGTLTEGDIIIQTLNLTELSYSQPVVSTTTSMDGETGYIFETHSLGDFVFGITAELYSNYALADNTLVSPTETKITISIENFPFQDTNGDSLMALQIRASSEMNVEEEFATTETEIKVKSETAEGFFSWIPTASVDGVNKPVNSSITTNEETLINLSYPHGKDIIHDPILGIGILEPIAPIFAVPIYFFSMIVLTVVALALFFVGRREICLKL
ncbi:MAG: hypothetical protein HXX80_02330 [Nitrososphaerales archaeon]|nr:hypothetical protein [Nitrososphaerales archaeon]